MRRWRNGAVACSALLMTVSGGGSAWAGSGCDEYNPNGPARTAHIRMDSTDLVEHGGGELRSFIATGSVGRVDAVVVSSSPRGVVRGVSAVPEISRVSPHFGEKLKGIAVVLSLTGSHRPASIVLNVRQVCAEYFHNTFLYY